MLGFQIRDTVMATGDHYVPTYRDDEMIAFIASKSFFVQVAFHAGDCREASRLLEDGVRS